jgi:hypothetical protein
MAVHLGSESPVTCVYAYIAGLGSRLMDLARWLASLDVFFVWR